MPLPSWLWFGKRTTPKLDLAMEGTIEAMVMDLSEDFAAKYWSFFLDLADKSNAEFTKAARKHLYDGAPPPDADRVVVRSWLLAQVARRLQTVTLSELSFLLRPRGTGARRNPPMSDLYEQMYGGDDNGKGNGAKARLGSRLGAGMRDLAREDEARWREMERRVSHPSFSMTAERAAESALRIQEQALARETAYQQELLRALGSLETPEMRRDPLANRVLWFAEQIAQVRILWDRDTQGRPIAFYEALCPDPRLTARKTMDEWIQSHVEPMVDRIFKYTTKAVADAVTLIRKTTRLKKDQEYKIKFLVVGAFYFETVNEIVRQAGLDQNPASLRMRYLKI
jgi:hypothetical protein